MKLADIFFQLKKDMQYIEKELAKSISTKDALLYKTSSHLLKAGGKRIRPVFVLLGGKFGTYDREKLKYLAVALELIHMATLVHDDVIDDAATRRGQQTVKSKWDNRLAMYTGDYILAEGLLTVTELENPRLHQILSRSIKHMVQGEIEQIRDFHDWDQSLRNYLRRIKRKTALLIAVSCQLGAIVCGAPEKYVRALYNYGYNVGMAFQITDDILDFVGDEKTLGKPAGSDLRQGNITLPALHSYQDPKIGPLLRSWMETEVNEGGEIKSRLPEVKMEDAIQLIRSAQGLHYAQALADRYISRAMHWLEDLPEGQPKKSLQEIAKFIGKRQF